VEVKHKVLLGLPPHNFDEKHPLYLNFGIFFHLDTKSSIDEEYMHINDWLSTQNSILNFESLVEFKKFVESLNHDKKNIINLAIFSKREFMSKKQIQDIKQFIEENNQNKHIEIILKTDIDKFEIFYSKLEFYNFMKELNLENYISDYSLLSDKNFLNSIQTPFLLRSAISSGGKDTFLINEKNEITKLIRNLNIKSLFKLKNKNHWFVQQFIDTKSKLGYYRSYRILAFNSLPYFIYPNVSYSNPITHVSEKDKLSKDLFLDSVNVGIEIFNLHKTTFQNIFESLGNPFAALDFVCIDNDILYISEAELKYGPSEKYIINQIEYFNLDKDYFENIRKQLNVEPLTFEDLYSIFE